MDRFSDAEPLWRSCEGISVKKLGLSNPITLNYANDLLNALFAQRRLPEARDKGEELLRVIRDIPEADHFRMFGVLSQLGTIYVNLSQYDRALAYHQEALSGLERTVGFQNIETIHAQFRLGAVYGETGDMSKAANIYAQNKDACARTRGITNEWYLRAAVNLGSVQRLGGHDVDAEQTFLALLPTTRPDREHRFWPRYIGRAGDELRKLYVKSNRLEDAHSVQEWMNGNAEALKNIRTPQELQNEVQNVAASTWSPRVGDDDEVGLFAVCFIHIKAYSSRFSPGT